MLITKAELVYGPQDGARVCTGSEEVALPEVLYVGPKWLGDGYAAWGRKQSKRFPCCYVRGVHGRDGFGPQWVWRFRG